MIMISDIGKMQALFVPSLEYKVYSLLKKLTYSADFQLTKQFSYLKRFIDAIVAWTDPLNGIAEYDIDITKGVRKNTVTHVMKNDLITCFLDSIILYHRLNKICHELDSLEIENNILRSLNCWMDDFTISITAMNCNMNLEATTFCHAKKPVICKKSIELLTTNDIYHDEIIKHIRLIIPKCQMQKQQNQQILYSDQNFLQKEQNNMSYCTHNTNKQKREQNDNINKFFNDKSYNIKLKKIQTAPTLKIIVRKMYLENAYFSRPLIIRLFLPCKTNDLIQCIFEVDPFLSESCLIMMKRKFQDCMYNVCSCLNDSFGKLNAKVAKTLRLDCNIRPGYISFKLKVSGESNTDRYLFVARVPICQNVCKHMIQQDSITLSCSSKLNIKTNVSQYFNLCENNNNKFNITFNDVYMDEENVYMDEENNKLNNMCYSYLDQSFIENIMPNTLKYKRKTKKETTCTIIKKIPKYFNDSTICSCDKACENITNEILNMADLEEVNENFCKILDAEIDCDDHMKKYKENPHLSNSIIKNNESMQLANNANYLCLSYDIFIKTNKNIITIYTKNLTNSSQITNVNEYEQICLSDKESNARNKYHDINIHSITSFVQNADRDKQLVELNCNCFLQNAKMINKRSHKNNSSLNSTKVDIECDSSCSYQHDFINITTIDNISKENIIYVFDIFQNDLDAIKTRNTNYFDTIKTSSKNNLLTASIQTPRLIRSSKRINVDISSRTVWLTSDFDTDISIIMKKCNKKVTNSSTQSLIVLKRKNIHDVHIKKHNTYDGIQNSIKLSDRLFMSKKELRSNRESRSSDISADKCFYAKNFSTSKTLCSCPLITVMNGFTTNENREKFEKSCKLKKSYVYKYFDINSITSTIKYKATFCQDDYFADIRLRTTYMMTKFRNSINKSINRLKRLIRAKLARVLLNKKTETIIILKNKFSKNKAFFRNMKKKTIGKCIRQNYDVTSCSTYDYYKQSCILFSQSPNVLSIQSKNWERTNSKGGIKVYHHKLPNSSKILSSFHSIIQITPQSYDLLTSTTENLKEWKSISNNKQLYCKEKNIKNKSNYNGNYQYNFKNYRTNIIISSSDEISFAENYPKYFKYYIRKRKRKTCNKNIMNGFIISENIKHNTYAQASEDYMKKDYQKSPLYVHEGKFENVYEQIYHMFRLKNLKMFSSLKNNRQIVGKKTNISDYFDNHCLRKKFAFMVLTQKDNNYISNIDLDFKLKLLRYVELCKNVKRALIRTY